MHVYALVCVLFYDCIDGHSVVRIKLSSVIVHDVHSCEQIQWKVL